MIRAESVAFGSAENATDTVQLSHDDRRRRRISLTTDGGMPFLLDLAKTPTLRDGDGLVLEDGRIVRVVAAPEALLEIGARDARHLVRLAWHLGNRHLPTQIVEGDVPALRIRADHVIADMAAKLGGTVREIEAPFDPEGGAYGHGGTMGHSHVDAHRLGGHDHDHDARHAHTNHEHHHG